jgi:hypothetical protein
LGGRTVFQIDALDAANHGRDRFVVGAHDNSLAVADTAFDAA